MLNELHRILAAASDEDNDIKVNKITSDQLVSLCQTSYSSALKAFKQNKIIYKGMHDKRLPELSIVTSGYRISENTGNLYTLLFSDILSNWSMYPKRNRSFVCTSSLNVAKGFGKPYILFPANETNIGICPTDDMWDSFKNSKLVNGSIDAFVSDYIYFIDTGLELYFNSSYLYDANELKNILDELTKHVKNNKEKMLSMFGNYKRLRGTIDAVCDRNISICDYLNEQFDPKTNGFNLTNIENYNLDTYDGNEIWFSGDTLFIYRNDKNISILKGIE